MSWESFLTRLAEEYPDAEQASEETERLVLVPGGSEPPETIMDVEELASSEGVELFFSNFLDNGELEFTLKNMGFTGDVFEKFGTEQDELGPPEDPLAYLQNFNTYSDRSELEDKPGIWVQEAPEDAVRILIIEDAATKDFGSLLLRAEEDGWLILEEMDQSSDEFVTLSPPDWRKEMVIPWAEAEAWLYGKYVEVKGLEEEPSPTGKVGFVGLQYLPDGQDPHDYQRDLGPSSGFPSSEHTQNWLTTEDDERYLKENLDS